MKEYEIKIGEDMKPYRFTHVKAVDVNPGDEEHIDELIQNALSNPFFDTIATYMIRIKEKDVKKLIIIPDFMNNNVKLLSVSSEAIDTGQIVTIHLNGFCRDCKFSFFVYQEEDEIEGE